MIAHEVTNVGNDRGQLSNMANQAREEIGAESLTVVADRGYYKRSGNPRLRASWHHYLRTETPYIWQQSGRQIWQAGRHLSCGVGRVSMPCGAVTKQATFVDGRRHIIALLLLLRLPVLLNAKAMYDG